MVNGDWVRIEQHGPIAHLVFDAKGASINKLDLVTLKELEQAVITLEQSSGIKGVIVTSTKPTYIVGADIREFNALFKGQWPIIVDRLTWTNTIFRRLELLPMPTVAAINGAAMGGGLEVALACDARVMSDTAIIALPEVTLGLHPGFGGSVRLPRISNASIALDWMVQGHPKKAEEALTHEVVDGVASPDELMNLARETLDRCISGAIDFKERRRLKSHTIHEDRSIVNEKIAEYRKGFTNKDASVATSALVNLLEEALWLGYEPAVALEIESFCRLGQTPQSRALVGVFENDQAVKKLAKKRAKSAATINRVGVIGAGIMGSEIALQHAIKGYVVSLIDNSESALSSAFKRFEKILNSMAAKGRLKEEVVTVLSRIKKNGDIAHCDLVIEAVTEQQNTKLKVLKQAQKDGVADSIVVTNTSTLSINHLAKALPNASHFAGMHFFNPVLKMPLVEVIKGDKTEEDTINTLVGVASTLSKTPIVLKDCVGFFVNRVLFPYFAGFNQLILDGADLEQVETVMKEFGWPMGPATLLDVIGIDTAKYADDVLVANYPERMTHSGDSVLEMLFKADRLGVKSGVGFYQYDSDKRKVKEVSANDAVTIMRDNVIQFDEAEIIDRLMIPMCIEVARTLEEGIVESAAEADMALLLGLGFPRYKGGITRYMDEMTMAEFVNRCKPYEKLGARYEPTQTMRDMAVNNESYNG